MNFEFSLQKDTVSLPRRNLWLISAGAGKVLTRLERCLVDDGGGGGIHVHTSGLTHMPGAGLVTSS
jgi:hypothetical protein